MCKTLIITLFWYNTDSTMDPKISVIMRFQCIIILTYWNYQNENCLSTCHIWKSIVNLSWDAGHWIYSFTIVKNCIVIWNYFSICLLQDVIEFLLEFCHGHTTDSADEVLHVLTSLLVQKLQSLSNGPQSSSPQSSTINTYNLNFRFV